MGARDDIFEQYHNLPVTRSLVEAVCSSPGAYWEGDDYKCLAPHRNDGSIGSFHISSAGVWHDFATQEGGDLVDLVCLRDNCDKTTAAKTIVAIAGQTPVDDREQAPAKKHARVQPADQVPAGAEKKLNAIVKQGWFLNRYGKAVEPWVYRKADGSIDSVVVRAEKDGGKSILPFYFGIDNEWHIGQKHTDQRPLFNLDKLAAHPGLPVLLVEGERCGSVDVPGYVVTTWPGGANAVKKADLSPLRGRDVIAWPDCDEPGLQAMLTAAEVLR